MRSAADEARAILLDCLPVKRTVASAPSYIALRPGMHTAFASVRFIVSEGRALLLDCLPIKSMGQPFETDGSAQPLHPGLRSGVEMVLARVRSTADEARAVLADCLPLKRPPLPAADLRPRARPVSRPAASRLRLPYSADDRQAIVLLFLPFLLVASALAISHSVRRGPTLVETAAKVPHLTEGPLAEGPRVTTAPGVPTHSVEIGPAVAPVAPVEQLSAELPTVSIDTPTVEAPSLPSASVGPPAQIAMLEVPEGMVAGGGGGRGICVKTASLSGRAGGAPVSLAPTPEAFGLRLAQAARAQVESFVIYSDKYRSISYPMGDVPFLFGVCTDVVVRAYRALGLDLQQLVQQARAGSGDRSIDHRRTEVLRRFFAARGESLLVTTFAEDYLPGDVVTYYRPQNQRTRSHIAIVSDIVAPSGRPMIVHNRGWGPEMEDALFVDEITGHYRYYGPAQRQEIEKAGSVLPSQREDANRGNGVASVSFAPLLKAETR